MQEAMNRRAAGVMMLIGVLQGCVLLWLWKASEWQVWPATDFVPLGGLLWAALAVPVVWYLSESAGASGRFRGGLMAAMAFAYALLGAYGGWLDEPLESVHRSARLINSSGDFAHAVAASVLGFVLLTLLLHRRTGGWNYATLFGLAWRNALLCISAAAITGLFWMALYAGAMLLDVIGLGFVRELIKKPVFAFPVTGLVVAAAFVQGHRHALMLGAVHRYSLALMAWLLPLMLGFGVIWAVALPFVGVDTLFATRNAAFLLLWFAALAVHFLNCAWQDGRDTPVYPVWLHAVVRYAWLALIPVVAIAGWALWLRIEQYGLTESRVWAVFVCGLALLYVVGYSVSVLRTDHWMATVGKTNIAVAVAMCAGLALLVTPLADPRRLAVEDQVHRLLASDARPAAFDYDYLRWGASRWGPRALDELSVLDSNEREKDIAGRAREMLAMKERYPRQGAEREESVLTVEDLRNRIEILSGPDGARDVPDSLYRWLLTAGPATGRGVPYCYAENECLLWMTDLNGDTRDEAILLVGFSGGGERTKRSLVLARRGDEWSAPASLHKQVLLDDWRKAVRDGKVRLLDPVWPDLVIGDELVPSYRTSE